MMTWKRTGSELASVLQNSGQGCKENWLILAFHLDCTGSILVGRLHCYFGKVYWLDCNLVDHCFHTGTSCLGNLKLHSLMMAVVVVAVSAVASVPLSLTAVAVAVDAVDQLLQCYPQ